MAYKVFSRREGGLQKDGRSLWRAVRTRRLGRFLLLVGQQGIAIQRAQAAAACDPSIDRSGFGHGSRGSTAAVLAAAMAKFNAWPPERSLWRGATVPGSLCRGRDDGAQCSGALVWLFYPETAQGRALRSVAAPSGALAAWNPGQHW